jgi:hypothetical protein
VAKESDSSRIHGAYSPTRKGEAIWKRWLCTNYSSGVRQGARWRKKSYLEDGNLIGMSFQRRLIKVMEQLDIFEADKLMELNEKKKRFEEVIKACGAPLKIVAVNKYYDCFIAEYEGRLKSFLVADCCSDASWKSGIGWIRDEGQIPGYYTSTKKGIPPNYEWVEED